MVGVIEVAEIEEPSLPKTHPPPVLMAEFEKFAKDMASTRSGFGLGEEIRVFSSSNAESDPVRVDLLTTNALVLASRGNPPWES